MYSRWAYLNGGEGGLIYGWAYIWNNIYYWQMDGLITGGGGLKSGEGG